MCRAEQTKQNLLFAAFSILKEENAKALSAAQVAKTANISKSSFFHHFPQIEDFYLYILDSIIDSFNQQIKNNQFKNFQGYIRFSGDLALDFVSQSPEIFTAVMYFLDQSRNKTKTMKRLKRMCDININLWVSNLKPLLPAKMKDDDLQRLAYLLDMYFIGLGHHFIITPNKAHYQKITEDFIKMITLYINNTYLTKS